MEFFNKLANVVITNPLIKDFEILDVVSQAGPWVIHNAVKRSTKEKVSVFVLSKKMFDKMSKSSREYVLDRHRTGVRLLTKVRHPKFLTVQHPLEESRESLAFATEPCSNALSTVIKCKALSDVEIKYGILQLLDGVAFLHGDLKRCHRNICLDSIVINNQGLWKIFGLEFSTVSGESSEPPGPEFVFYDNEPYFSQPNIEYVAPELLTSKFGDTSADMYSLGCLIFSLFNKGASLRKSESARSALMRADEISVMPASSLGNVPSEATNDVKQLLLIAPTARQQVENLQQAGFLSDVGAVSLQFLDQLMLKNRTQKIAFFKELPNILPRLPIEVRKRRILTQLFECCKETDLIPFILPSIFHVGTDLDPTDFQCYISPGLKPMLATTDPPHVPLIIIQNLQLIISKSTLDDSKGYVLPVMFRGLENPMVELQESVLKLVPEIVDLMDYSTLRHQLLPKIKSCCLETRLLKIRVGSLICIAKVIDSTLVDKSLTADIILPLLEQVPSREPAVLMSIIGIYQKLLKHKSNLLDKDTLANRCIPIIFPMLVSPSLNVQQFSTCSSIVKEMMAKVEKEQLGKLKQLAQDKTDQEQSLKFSKEVASNKQVGELVTKMDQMFGTSDSGGSQAAMKSVIASSNPAVKKANKFDQLAPDVMSNGSRKSSTASNQSMFSDSMANMSSTDSVSKPMSGMPVYDKTNSPSNSSLGGRYGGLAGSNSPNLGSPPTIPGPPGGSSINNKANTAYTPMSNSSGIAQMNSGFSAFNSSSVNSGMNSGMNSGFSGMNPGFPGIGNSMNSSGMNSSLNPGMNSGMNLGFSGMNPGFSGMGNSMNSPGMNSSLNPGMNSGLNSGFSGLNNGFNNSGMNSGMNFGMNYSSNQPNLMPKSTQQPNSLDNLFGAKPSQPSLNQLNKPDNQSSNNASIDLNDIFG